jgi:3-phosphoshikimate 1-carboxyvinyltransferase
LPRRAKQPSSKTKASRDHTERLLKHFGAEVRVEAEGAQGRKITLRGEPSLRRRRSSCRPIRPRPPFPWWRHCSRRVGVILTDVMTNPLRTGLIVTLREMGADIEALDVRSDGGERWRCPCTRIGAAWGRGAGRRARRP